jgi:hypothetical protein
MRPLNTLFKDAIEPVEFCRANGDKLGIPLQDPAEFWRARGKKLGICIHELVELWRARGNTLGRLLNVPTEFVLFAGLFPRLRGLLMDAVLAIQMPSILTEKN